MQGHDYIFALQDKDRRFWQVDAAGNVTISNKPYFLQFSPDGWSDTQIDNVLNKKYWAIDRNVSSSYKYVEDGAKILKHIFYKKGVEESVYLVICEQRLAYTPGVEYGFWYKQIFRSEIDMSTFDHNGPYVTANTVEDGLAKHLESNENTVYEIPFGTEKVKLDGILLNEKANYLLAADGTEIDNALFGDSFWLPFIFITRESILPSIAFLTQDIEDTSGQSYDDRLKSQNYFAKASEANIATINVRIKGTLIFTCTEQDAANGVIMRFLRSKLPIGNQSDYEVVNISPLVQGTTSTISVDITIPLQPGERLYFEGKLGTTGVNTKFQFEKGSDLDITFSDIFKATYNSFLRPQQVFAELISKISDGEYSAEDCPYFGDLQHIDKVFTSGDAIRGIENPTLKISLSQFMDFWNSFDEVGIKELNKKVLLDRKKTLVDFTNVIDLGEVSRPDVKLDKDFPFNELNIGYPDIKNEIGLVNGKNEFNTTFVFSMGTSKTPRKYQKVSPVKASCYDVENVRISQAQKDTTDNRSDNDLYILHIEKTLQAGNGSDIPDHYLLDRTLNPFLLNVDNKETVFNVIFSPKRCFYRSSDFLHSCFYKSENKVFKFIKADRNDKMSYVNGSDIVVENANELIGGMDPAFFFPVPLEVEAQAPDELVDATEINPLQIFQFTMDGKTYKGITVKTGINPKTNRKQTYTLLPTADTDLTPLIDYYG